MNVAEARPLARTAAIRPIAPADNAAVAAIIRQVLPEFGGTGEGCAVSDPEVDCMHETYANAKSAFFVVECEGKIVGCGGVAPLKGGDNTTAELQKYYLLPEVRGQGLGGQLVTQCLEAARQCGFTHCYLETFANMHAAQALYRKCGFTPLSGPMGNTGHNQCTHWYIKEL